MVFSLYCAAQSSIAVLDHNEECEMRIRAAQWDDLSAILAIYNEAVLNSTAIWNEQQLSLDNRQHWFLAKKAQQQPILVAIHPSQQTVMGYASFGPWRDFTGYQHTVEHSIYLAPDYRGQGVGSALLTALISQAQQQHKHAMIAAIDAQNLSSIALHQKFGFQWIGTFPQVGRKFERWLDLSCWQLML
jgi:L-amino acid N-acyltransferase YncA